MLDRRGQDLHAGGGEDAIETSVELAVVVADEEPERVGAQNWIRLCDLRVFVEQPVEPVAADDPEVSARARFGQRRQRCCLG